MTNYVIKGTNPPKEYVLAENESVENADGRLLVKVKTDKETFHKQNLVLEEVKEEEPEDKQPADPADDPVVPADEEKPKKKKK